MESASDHLKTDTCLIVEVSAGIFKPAPRFQGQLEVTLLIVLTPGPAGSRRRILDIARRSGVSLHNTIGFQDNSVAQTQRRTSTTTATFSS